jgi:hypothetical protein
MYAVRTMERRGENVIRWLFDSHYGLGDRLISRWVFLRALAAIYFSAFCSLLFQIKGLIGPEGVLPAQHYLAAVARAMGPARFWFAPTLFWISASSRMLMAVMALGLIASLAAFFNVWPRLSFLVCWICFLSFVASTNVFSNYQSDGMLLEAGFISLTFVPPGVWPGWGANHPPSRASLFLLQWEWFRIYFESGMVKLLSGDEQWRNLTAMDEYYQNGPLPTWIGWYVEHLPHWFHAATAAGTLVMELGLVFLMFFPRRARLVCFCIVTPWEAGVILTANYTFLNYLVLSLGFLLLDDRVLRRFVPVRFRSAEPTAVRGDVEPERSLSIVGAFAAREFEGEGEAVRNEAHSEARSRLAKAWSAAGFLVAALMLTWIAYDTTVEMIGLPLRGIPLPEAPIRVLDPFRIANQYGLFAVMTRGRYEIEFQGSEDGSNWLAYPFRYKPQELNEAPGIYAPYQPRFDWNLWFASLGDWQENDMVPMTEERLLTNDADVLGLFRANPFAKAEPRFVRAVLWQYWFTSEEERRRTGDWWRRKYLGLYAPEVTLTGDGKPEIVQFADELPPHD